MRKPKLFFVSTSTSLDGMQPEGAVQPSTFKGEAEGVSVQDEASLKLKEEREGRFQSHWMTTTSISGRDGK